MLGTGRGAGVEADAGEDTPRGGGLGGGGARRSPGDSPQRVPAKSVLDQASVTTPCCYDTYAPRRDGQLCLMRPCALIRGARERGPGPGLRAGAARRERLDQDRFRPPHRMRRTALILAGPAEVDRVPIETHASGGVPSESEDRPRSGHLDAVAVKPHCLCAAVTCRRRRRGGER